MKKLLLLFGVFALIFQSCEVNEIESQEESLRIDLAKIENLKNLDENSQRIAFRLLNHKEKYTFRMFFINDFIENSNLNKEQISLIEELKSNFNSTVYLKNDYSEYFKTIFITDWSNRALNHFSMKEIRYLANSGNNRDFSNSAQQRASECKCHEGSVFRCTTKVTISTGVPEIIEAELVDCDSSQCQTPGSINSDGYWEEDESGCGWFWLESCDGTC